MSLTIGQRKMPELGKRIVKWRREEEGNKTVKYLELEILDYCYYYL